MAGVPLNRIVTATSTATGAITFTFPDTAPLGQVWQGTLYVDGAPLAANFRALVASQPWGSGQGPQVWGPVQMSARLSLVVLGTGLTPSTQYTCTFQGVSLNASDADPIGPSVQSPIIAGQALNLLDETVTVNNGQTLTLLLNVDCSMSDHVLLAVTPATQRIRVVLNWTDHIAPPSDFEGQLTSFTVGAGVQAQPVFRNLGRLLTLQLVNASGSATTVALNCRFVQGQARPRWLPTTEIPLLDVQGQPVAGGGSVFPFAAAYAYAGPAYVHFSTNAAAFLIAIGGTDYAGNTHEIFSSDNLSGSARLNVVIKLPPLDLSGSFTNNDAGAKAFDLSLIPEW